MQSEHKDRGIPNAHGSLTDTKLRPFSYQVWHPIHAIDVGQAGCLYPKAYSDFHADHQIHHEYLRQIGRHVRVSGWVRNSVCPA